MESLIGSVLIGVQGRNLLMRSPDGREFLVEPWHAVWDYGDSSQAWLRVDGVDIEPPDDEDGDA